MTASAPLKITRAAAVAVLACVMPGLAACGGEDGNGGAPPTAVVTPTPPPSPPPPSVPTETALFDTPFGLTSDTTFDIFGWQGSESGWVPATQINMRWNAATNSYEVMLPDQQWGRLVGTVQPYPIMNQDGSRQPADLSFNFAPHSVEGAGPSLATPRYLYGASTTLGAKLNYDWFVFGRVTASEEMPTSGTKTCKFNVDDNGSGELSVDFGARTVTGSLDEFYGSPYAIPMASFALGAASFSTPGPNGPIDAQFFGPNADELVVRWVADTSNPGMDFTKLWPMLCDAH